MNPNSIMIFHDSVLIYKALKLSFIYLESVNVGYTFFKCHGSEMSALILGNYRQKNIKDYLGQEDDKDMFFSFSEARRIKIQFLRRARKRFVPSKVLNGQMPFEIEIITPRIEPGYDEEERV